MSPPPPPLSPPESPPSDQVTDSRVFFILFSAASVLVFVCCVVKFGVKYVVKKRRVAENVVRESSENVIIRMRQEHREQPSRPSNPSGAGVGTDADGDLAAWSDHASVWSNDEHMVRDAL